MLLAGDPHADAGRSGYNDSIVDVLFEVLQRHAQQIGRGHEGQVRPWAEEDAADLGPDRLFVYLRRDWKLRAVSFEPFVLGRITDRTSDLAIDLFEGSQ